MRWTKQLSLKVKFFLGSLFYLTYAPKAFRYSRWKEKVEREMTVAPPAETFEQPGKLLRAEPTANGAQFYFEQAELEICFLTPDFVRLDWQPGLRPVPYAIARHIWEPVATHLEETADGWTLTSYLNDDTVLQLAVAFDGRITVLDSQGAIVREELPPQKTGDGWTHRSSLRPEEAVYGLGERAVPLNLRLAREVTEEQEVTQTPKAFRMWNYDAAGKYDAGADPMYICIPLYWGLHHQGSYLVFYENSFDAHFTFSEVATAAFEGGALRYYIAVGAPQQLLERYTELTGRSPMPPRWALGYHQSHWGYRTEDAVRETYQGFEAHNLPLSVIHLDIDVQVGFRAFTVDPDRFPNLRGFIQELLEHNVQFVTILNPGVKLSRKSNLFLEGRVLDAFCRLANGQLVVAPVWPGWCVFPDFTNPVVRRWWSRQYEFLLTVGVAGFWHDMNEPAAFIAWGDRSYHPAPLSTIWKAEAAITWKLTMFTACCRRRRLIKAFAKPVPNSVLLLFLVQAGRGSNALPGRGRAILNVPGPLYAKRFQPSLVWAYRAFPIAVLILVGFRAIHQQNSICAGFKCVASSRFVALTLPIMWKTAHPGLMVNPR